MNLEIVVGDICCFGHGTCYGMTNILFEMYPQSHHNNKVVLFYGEDII